jgi:phage N-6-adenine-methyltransferase
VSLVGFKARNHPKQVARDGARDDVDERMTPLHLWIPWNERWGFTLDAAASDGNHLCDRYFTIEDNGLAQSWAGQRVWVNPPFSAMAKWALKALVEFAAGCDLIVMLAPANRTEQRWWQEAIEPGRDCGRGLTTYFLPGRINFPRPDNLMARYHSSAPFGCVLLVWERSPKPRLPSTEASAKTRAG